MYDFDERIVQAVNRFADKERIEHLTAHLYNCLDAFPIGSKFDCFYTKSALGREQQRRERQGFYRARN